MLVAQRHDEIVRLINGRGSMRVTELSTQFGVTEETIRRDLDSLEALGLLRRSHGGAVKIGDHLETPYAIREIERMDEKREIAQIALSLISPGDQIIIDASSTTLCLAGMLPNMPLKVVTNSLRVASELVVKDKISVILTGGTLAARSMSLLGPTAEQGLERYHVSRAFLSCKGVHVQRGFSESSEQQALVKQKMISVADEVYIMADSNKFGVQDFTVICGVQDVTGILTDAATDEQTAESYRQQGIRVIRGSVTY